MGNEKPKQPLDPKKKVSINITTEHEIKEWVEKKALEDERSVSIYVTRILRDIKDGEKANN